MIFIKFIKNIILTILFIITLYNILINKKNFPNSFNSISLDSRHELNMGCDYYIDKYLHIYYYNDIIFSYINLKHEKGYYWFVSLLDEDEDGYEEEYIQYKKNKLEPVMEPIVIYSNNTFNKLSFENKYKEIIQYELNLFNKTWNDINKIIKIENRYER